MPMIKTFNEEQKEGGKDQKAPHEFELSFEFGAVMPAAMTFVMDRMFFGMLFFLPDCAPGKKSNKNDGEGSPPHKVIERWSGCVMPAAVFITVSATVLIAMSTAVFTMPAAVFTAAVLGTMSAAMLTPMPPGGMSI